MDEIRLTVPSGRDYLPVAHLVLSGLGSRLALTIDEIDDLALALDTLIDADDTDQELTIAIRVGDGLLETELGPFVSPTLHAELDGGPAGMGVRRVLETVVDAFDLAGRDDGFTVTLRKRVARAEGAG